MKTTTMGPLCGSPADIRQAITRFYEETVNVGDSEALGPWITSAVHNHNAPPGAPQGHDAFVARQEMVRAAFPDFRIDVQRVIVEGDYVVTHNIGSGTHRGPFEGMPPTGRSFRAQAIEIYRLEDGRIAERWGVEDLLAIQMQLTGAGE